MQDLLFVDPPYTVRHDNNGFIKYNEQLFSWDDQLRLRDAVLRAKERGARLF
jgi:DNA adenine methylase